MNKTIEITVPVTKEKVERTLEQLTKEFGKLGLRKHFGKLKRNLESLEFQKQVRDGWD